MGELRTLCDLYAQISEGTQKNELLKIKDGKSWRVYSSADFTRSVHDFACGLLSLGLKAGDKVALLSEDRPEWPICDFAVLTCGAADVPLYPTMNSKDSAFIVHDCDAEILIVSTPEQADKLLAVRGSIPQVRDIIILDPPRPDQEGLLRFDEVMARGREFAQNREELHRKSAAAVTPEMVASIIYTSGTTGVPKGVELTHRNFMENAKAALDRIRITDTDRALVFLPLSHSFERLVDYCYFMRGVTIAYSESIEKVTDNLAEFKPNVMAAVPRFYEKVYGRLMDQAAAGSPLKKRLIHWGVATAKAWAEPIGEGKKPGVWISLQHWVADKLIYQKLRAKTGGHMRFFISGGAPLSRELQMFFYGAGLRILEGYGLTETTPVVTVNEADIVRFGSIGRPLSNLEVKIVEDGELWVRGPSVMKGYYKRPDATAEVLTEDGWLKTGDIARMDEEGWLYITDRKKELLVTAGGKNIAPAPIEGLLKTNKYVVQAVLIGDNRPFITALIVPNWPNVLTYLHAKGVAETDPKALCTHPQVAHLFGHVLERTNAHLSKYEQVKKCRLLPAELTQEEGELTPTLKVKRRIVLAKFAQTIESMYSDGGDGTKGT